MCFGLRRFPGKFRPGDISVIMHCRPMEPYTGVPNDLFGEISILLGNLPSWHFHRIE